MSHSNRRRLLKGLGASAATAFAVPRVQAAIKPTPTQIEGPFYPVHAADELDADLTHLTSRSQQAQGDQILVSGRVLDQRGQPITDALVDIWQANHHGRYLHPNDDNPAPHDPNFQYWAKVATDVEGRYKFKTIMPGAYRTWQAANAPLRCRHIHFKVSRSGYQTLVTQMYFAGDPLIEQDSVMARTPPAERQRLICSASQDVSSGLDDYAFEIVLATA